MALDLTGIQNVGEFYSHHYLDALLENDLKGLFAKWRSDDEAATNTITPDRQLFRLSGEYFKAKTQARPELSIQSRYDPSHRLHVALLEALGYSYTFSLRYIKGELAVPILGGIKRDGQEYLWLVETPFPGKEEWMDADSSPFDHRLFRQQYPQTEESYLIPDSRWEDLVGDIFHSDEPPRWLVFLSGRYVYLIDRTKWGRGQYLLFDLDEIMGRRQSQTLRAAAALLSREALCPDDGVPLHDTLDENSHKHAYSVSSNLKYGIRRAVELLANEYVWYQRNVAKQALFQDENLARKLTDETLIYLYRLLFLLYAEARAGELDVVPMKAEAYLKGYSLEALRDLEQVPLTTPQAQNGYFLNESLNRLFNLVDEGYQPQQLALPENDNSLIEAYDDYGFRVKGLHSPLFSRESTPHLSAVRFRNSILQDVIQLLSLSKETRRRNAQRGRISYAQLGINQLGAVYEALLSYSGFFAIERLFEVKPADAIDADETAQTYFIPESELERYLPEEFVYVEKPDGSRQRRSYEKGTFIFRLAGRDREKSASYYTPEVLTKCVVKYSLKELLKGKTADDILKITICELAVGSGAFINEALNQLADAYLELKQKELGKRIPPDDYRVERQKVKYYLAVNNAYGVDLNPTAVRLAEVSLWLNILYPGAPAPWFGAHLATGNSLIGARRQVYSVEEVQTGSYKEKTPQKVPVGDGHGGFAVRPANTIYHWLLPDSGMAAFDNDKVIKELAPDEVQTIKNWRKEFIKPFTSSEIKNLLLLSDQADDLWVKALQERLLFLERTHQVVYVWGQEEPQKQHPKISIQQSEKELVWLQRHGGPLARLKLAMDYWCALWFWPIPDAHILPTRPQYLEDLTTIFAAGEDSGFEYLPKQLGLFDQAKSKQTQFAEMKQLSVNNLMSENFRITLVQRVAEKQCFHHWEVSFIEVFAKSGGFGLIVGNPPWVKLGWDESGILSDYDPLIAIRKFSASKTAEQRNNQLIKLYCLQSYIFEFSVTTGNIQFLNSLTNYPLLDKIQPNLYKCFICQAWNIGKDTSHIGLLHPEGIYETPNGGKFRSHIYPRLIAHFQFQNARFLFSNVHDQTIFSINIYVSKPKPTILFNHIVNIYHPSTIDLCFSHDGYGSTPPPRGKNGEWTFIGHKKRIISVNVGTLALFAKLFDEKDIPQFEARLPIIHSEEILNVLIKFSITNKRLADFSGEFFSTIMWDQSSAQKRGIIRQTTVFPKNLSSLIYSGPNIYVANPFFKSPNEHCKHNQDYTELDLTQIPDDFLPRTNFMPVNLESYRKMIPRWNGKDISTYYKHVHRRRLSKTGDRTLVNALIPPQAGHINTIFSIAFNNNSLLAVFSGLCSSIVFDFFVKITGRSDMYEDLVKQLPIPIPSPKRTTERGLL